MPEDAGAGWTGCLGPIVTAIITVFFIFIGITKTFSDEQRIRVLEERAGITVHCGPLNPEFYGNPCKVAKGAK